MTELLEEVKLKCATEFYGTPYSFLTDAQKLSLTDLIAYSFAREFATKKLQDIITNH
jgi:hypothetical protein